MMQVCFIADAAALNHSTDSATPIMTVSTTDPEVDLMTSIRILVADKLKCSAARICFQI